MICGRVHPAGMKGAPYSEEYLSSTARYFRLDAGRLHRVLAHLEECEHPEVALLQNPDPDDEVQAACFVSSVWSRSYRLLGCPRSQIHRDFHYQCFFMAMQVLSEVGCTAMQIENLAIERRWESDAVTCLHEAWKNIRRYVNPNVTIQLMEGSWNLKHCTLEDHRPIAMCPYVSEGLNMHRIFLPHTVK
jgi:hypothetical protein